MLDSNMRGIFFDEGRPTQMYLSNDLLYHDLQQVAAKFLQTRQMGLSPPLWRPKIDEKSNNHFQLHETAGTALTGNVWLKLREYAVATCFHLECHYSELKSIFVLEDMNLYESVMSALFPKKFKNGEILHRFTKDEKVKVFVKKATFANSLGRKAELFYSEYCEMDTKTPCLTRIMRSIPREYHEKLSRNSVLGDAREIHIAYQIVPNGSNATQIFFYATCYLGDVERPAGDNTSFQIGNMSRPVQFVTLWGRSCAEIMTIVKRRRLGYQRFIRQGLGDIKRECSVCEKVASFASRGTGICRLCGNRACNACASNTQVEYEPGRVRTTRVCVRCIKFVNQCAFDDPNLKLLGTKCIVDVSLKSNSTENALDVENDRLIEYLYSLNVDRQMFAFRTLGIVPHDSGTPHPFVNLFQKHLSRPRRIHVNDCHYAEEGNERDYILEFSDGCPVPECPLPKNEHLRLDAIQRSQILDEGVLVQERTYLRTICEIAAKIMHCSTGYVSVLDADLQYAVADYNMPYKRLRRNETVCSHALLSLYPWIVRDALFDIRYREFFMIARSGYRFYANFPIRIQGCTIAGLVVIDKTPKHTVTAVQYARLVTLTHILCELLAIHFI